MPELSVEKLEGGFASVQSDLTKAGFRAGWCLTDSDATLAIEQVTDELRAHSPDIVVVGAGVRVDPDHLLMFEEIVNTVMREAPHCRIAFNTLLSDTLEAVKRWA